MNLKFYSIAIIFITVFTFSGLLHGQNKISSADRNNVRITQNADNTVTIRNMLTGYSSIKTLKNTPERRSTLPTLSINMTTLDTSLYSSKYRYLTTFKAGMEQDDFEITAIDINNNNRKDIILRNRNYENPNREQIGVGIYELGIDSVMHKIYQYSDSLILGGLTYGDMNNDGTMEVLFQPSDNDTLFTFLMTQSNPGSFPDVFFAKLDSARIYDRLTQPRIRNLDLDNNLELIFRQDTPLGSFTSGWYNQIARYNPQSQKLDIVYTNKLPEYSQGFAFGDFDLDGKPNIATGGIGGNLYMYEYQSGNTWSFSHIDSLETKNAYLLTCTNDLDNNGKPELWVGGDTYVNGVGLTRLVAYETTGDNTYQPAYQIDLIGIFSFYAGNMQAIDIDGDGKEEILLCIDQHILIFKYENSGYTLWFVKRNELAAAGKNSVVYSGFAADLDGKGFKELLMIKDILDPINGLLVFTDVYKSDGTLGVRNDTQLQPTGFKLLQNYPNPFNNSTTIEFQIPVESHVDIKIYNVLGKEVVTMTSNTFRQGTYRLLWDGKNQQGDFVSSGLYLLKMQTEQYSGSLKILLLK